MTTYIRRCPHCNNVTPHEYVLDASCMKLWDETDDEQIVEEYRYYFLRCPTCGDYALAGGFSLELPKSIEKYPILYPKSPELDASVPDQINIAYLEAFSIRSQAPNAFAGQIRRALEYLCKDQNASGRNLVDQLNSLVQKGIIPPTLAEMTTLIRLIGNIGVHASKEDVSSWHAELIDEFFRSIVEYVYVAPAKIERLKSRVSQSRSEGKPEIIED